VVSDKLRHSSGATVPDSEIPEIMSTRAPSDSGSLAGSDSKKASFPRIIAYFSSCSVKPHRHRRCKALY
jgi:hypothetical protein